MTSLDLGFFLVSQSSTASNNCSQLHIQTGTDLKWFQEGPQTFTSLFHTVFVTFTHKSVLFVFTFFTCWYYSIL